MRLLPFALLVATVGAARADLVVASRTIRADSVLTAADVALDPADMPGTFDRIAAVVGREARVMLYAGRPILPEDIGPPALVERNQIVPLLYARNGLTIRLEGRALGRGAEGETLRVMNLQSRATVTGRVMGDGTVRVD